MRFCYLSGLSPRFQGLSRSSWAGCLRITHPFASISSQQAGHPSIDLHVLGTPPAFILSQDQTLHLIDSYSTGFFTSFLHKSWRSFLCFIFLFSFQRAFRCPFEQPDDYLILSPRCQLFFFISYFLMSSALFQLTVNVYLLFPDRLALSIPQRLVYITSYLLFWQALFFPIVIHACMYLSNRHTDFGLFIIIFLLHTKY